MATAVEIARKEVPSIEYHGQRIVYLDSSEWWRRVQAAADELMAGRKVLQLSEKFDAPQYAAEFLAIARRDGAVRTHIRARVPTGKRNKRTGREGYRWATCNDAGAVLDK